MAWKEWLAFSCTHLPLHDPEGIDWLIQQIGHRQPGVVVALGDLFDADCLSAFAKSNKTALDREYQAVNAFCARINAAAPRAAKVWCMGNHEERMFREEYAHLSSVLDYRRHVTEAKRWKHLDYEYDPGQTYTIGQVTFWHGRNVGQASCKREAVQLGVPYGLYVYGHTHRPHPVHRISFGTTKLPYWHANPGTFIEPPAYMRTKDDSLWGQGIVVGAADTKRRHDGKCNWRAQTIVRKMMWGEHMPEMDPYGVVTAN